MRWIRAVAAAFATFSRIPMPSSLLADGSWPPPHMLVAFPAVGVLQGLVSAVWLAFAGAVPALCDMPLVTGVVLVAIPLAVNGGIHLDGLVDVADALASHAPRERRLQILKDPHVGAFGIIAVMFYLLMAFALFASWRPAGVTGFSLVFVYALSRCLSGFAVTTWPQARDSGMAASMAPSSVDAAPDARALVFVACISVAGLGGSAGVVGLVAAALAIAMVFWCRRVALRAFGGITGDVAGWMSQLTELVMLGVIIIGGML